MHNCAEKPKGDPSVTDKSQGMPKMWKTSRSDQMEHTASNMQKWENTRRLWAQRGLTGQHLDDPAAAAGTAQWVKPCTLLSPGPLRPHVDQST